MTPKQKSIELYNKFYLTSAHPNSVFIRSFEAKKKALFVVDEIIAEAKWWHDTSSYEESTDFEGGEKRVNYWQDVKTEIQKLDT